jgi:hypothetical protein
MDKDDFEQWRESPVTQWFMAKLRERATEASTRAQDQLYAMAAYPPDKWAEQQPGAAYVKGHSEALIEVTLLELNDLEPQEDKKRESNGR